MAKDNLYFINRRSGKREVERIYWGRALHFLYTTSFGKFLCRAIAHTPFFSRCVGKWQTLSLTKHKIIPFIKKYHVDLSECEKKVYEFTSFNDFFTRALKSGARILAPGPIIPADGRYLFYQNCAECDGFFVKGKKFSLEKLLNSASLAQRYREASLVMGRLCPSDYHRFHFPVDCTPSKAQLINGPLYSVNPIAIKQNISFLIENKRMITHLKSRDYGTILFIEIGATNVGSIHQTYLPEKAYKKGEEKGFFSFGGSSIILLFEKGSIQFANDLISNSAQHLETLCFFGDPLETSLNRLF